jgi:cell division transport system ATP-binding protein
MESTILRFENVWLSYDNEESIFEGVNVEIKKGEFVWLLGDASSGKTTFLRLAFMDILPTEGCVNILGFSSRRIRERDILLLRRSVAMIFENPLYLENRTIFDNFRILNIPSERMRKILKRFSLWNKGKKFPKQLSLGERQKLSIALVVARDPLLILADEPTSHLSSEENAITELFREINSLGTTCIIATSRKDLISSYPNKVLTISEKKIV